MDADRTAAPAALEGAEPSSARRFRGALAGAKAEVALATVAIEAEVLLDRLAELDGDALTEAGARDYHGHVAPVVARLRSALLAAAFADPAPTDPAPAAPAPSVEAMASLDVMAERLFQSGALRVSRDYARSLLEWILTGLPIGSERDAALSAILARLGAAPPADPARATLAGAVRDYLAAADALRNHRWEGRAPDDDLGLHYARREMELEANRDCVHADLKAALAAEPDAGDGWSFDMDAAPRDGRKFDGWCVHPETGGFGCRFPDVQMRGDRSGFGIMLWGPRGGAAWAYLDGRDGLIEPWRLVAWRPLSPPPAPRTGREG